MSTVISVENLGKKYTISHQQRGDSSSLREVITNSVSSFGKKMITPFRRSPAPCPLPLAPASASASQEDFWALKDVSFEVKQGDRIGIIGRNGAGKSTLLKILSRITEPTTGRIKIKGRVASLLEVGTGFHPELTGRENIFLNGAILGMGRQEISRKFDEIVAFAEIEKFLDTPVKRYSSGMYVRLAFAVAAHLEPEILIVDEVLAVGDAQFQKKCLGKMEGVGREGRTVLFVSHNMGAVSALCNNGILISNGRLVGSGKVNDVIDAYLASFLEIRCSLINLKNRGGTGEAFIEDIYWEDKNGNHIDLLASGSAYNIVIRYRSRIQMVSPVFKVSVYNSIGQLVAHLSNWLCNNMPCMPEGEGVARCHIDSLPLAQGAYRVNASINTDRILDHVDGCLHFRVTIGDFYGTGRFPDDLKEISLFPQSWDFRVGNP